MPATAMVIDGETAAAVPRTTTSEVHRYKANATDKRTLTRPGPGRTVTPCPKSSWTPPTQPNSPKRCSSEANGWPATPAASLAEFVGHPAYGLPQLRQDLERFVFLLGVIDGEQLFGP